MVDIYGRGSGYISGPPFGSCHYLIIVICSKCVMSALLSRSRLYGVFTKAENSVAGGEGLVGMYGSLTGASMDHIFDVLKESADFGPASALVDIGSGLGRPLLHAYYMEGIARIRGIEIDSLKCVKAKAFAERVEKVLKERRLVLSDRRCFYDITCDAIESIDSIDPATHAFTFWEGMSGESKGVIGRLFCNSETVHTIVIVQRAVRADPVAFFRDAYDFGHINLLATLNVTMAGSGRKFVAYILCKK